MRIARLKPQDADRHGTYYHMMNRIAGLPGEFPFGDVEREMFIRLLKKLAAFYTLDLLSWQVMGNHFHLIVFAPAKAVSPTEAARRYHEYYRNKKVIDPESPDCVALAAKLRDISEFMRELQHQFAAWYNRTRPVRRRGGLWADRFKSVVLEGSTAVWECLKYVELNCVRARLVQDPADYRFGSWGEWNGSGRHPYADDLVRHLRYNLGEHTAVWTIHKFHSELRKELARVNAVEAGGTILQIEAATELAARRPAPLRILDRRVRYWSDGLVVGGMLFVRNLMASILPINQVATHQTSPEDAGEGARRLCAWRRLRVCDS